MNTTDRYPTDYDDPTDRGLTPDIDNFARFTYPPRIPTPRPPVDEVPPASRPDLHVQRIHKLMGWQRDERKQRPCHSCQARPGAVCTTDTGKPMTGVHPGR